MRGGQWRERARQPPVLHPETAFGTQIAALVSRPPPGAKLSERSIMHKPTIVLFGALALAGGAALAKLPAPTAEQQAAAAAKKVQQEEQLKKEKAALERAQDSVVQHYKKSKGGTASSGSGQQTEAEKMPKTTSELPGGVGPKPERPVSGEAHSAPAK